VCIKQHRLVVELAEIFFTIFRIECCITHGMTVLGALFFRASRWSDCVKVIIESRSCAVGL